MMVHWLPSGVMVLAPRPPPLALAASNLAHSSAGIYSAASCTVLTAEKDTWEAVSGSWLASHWLSTASATYFQWPSPSWVRESGTPAPSLRRVSPTTPVHCLRLVWGQLPASQSSPATGGGSGKCITSIIPSVIGWHTADECWLLLSCRECYHFSRQSSRHQQTVVRAHSQWFL